MDLFEAIATRYSYRGQFTPQPVPREDLEKIINAGICAPSGCNLQTTSFVGVLDEDLRAKIAEILPKATTLSAPALIAVVTESREAYKGKAFEIEDYGAATQNLLLAVTALGYASVWIDGYLRDEGRNGQIARLLGLPPGKTVRAVLPLGVPAEPHAPAEKLPFDQRAQII